ncbi:MAG: TspO/MBR family protein [Lutimonas sp.]
MILLFALINFGGLALGSWLMGEGPTSNWYLRLNKASWTPPGWLFGVAWTTIMICYSFFLADVWSRPVSKYVWILFLTSLAFNISWNYFFFNLHWMLTALIILISLTVVIWAFFFETKGILKLKSLLLLPYMTWLLIAVSLNAFAVLKN